MKLSLLWASVSNIGLAPSATGPSVVWARLLNQLTVIALITSLLALSTYLIFFEGVPILLTTLANIAVELTAIFYAYRSRHDIARILTTFVFPTLMASNVIIHGGNFGETNIFFALGFTAFILYENHRRWQIASVLYISLLFAGSKLIAIQSQYDKTFEINPYDEIITFPMTLLVIGLIILLYQKELQKQEQIKSQLIQDLEKKNKETEQIFEELNQFTYIASHDLKTPLRTISSHLDLIHLHLSRQDYAAVDTDIRFAKLGAKQLYTLINDILEYKKVNQAIKEFTIVNLPELLLEVENNLGQLISAKKGVITYDELPQLHADQHEILTLFQNLLENALKYNETGNARVHIQYQHEGPHLIFDFADNGIGIDPEYHQSIFQFFKRLHTTATYEGTGIGLGLCKKICANYFGDIQVLTSTEEGTVFRVSLSDEFLHRPTAET